MAMLWTNDASTTIAGALTTSSTTINLQPGTGALFPNPTGGNFFLGTLWDQATKTITEIVKVTARSTDALTVIRGWEGTTVQTWNAGDLFANLVTAGTLTSFVQTGAGPADTSVVYAGTDTSTATNAIIANTTPVPAGGFAPGMVFSIKVGAAWPSSSNTSPLTLSLNGLAGVTVKRTDGSDLVPGNLIANQEYLFVYNGTYFNSTIPPIPATPPQSTFYVNPTGNDGNSGFANTAAAAFRTITGAMQAIKSRYISQTAITLRCAPGLYADGVIEVTNYIATWNIIGNTDGTLAGAANYVINATATVSGSYPPGASIARSCVVGSMGRIILQGFTLQSYFENVASTGGGVLEVHNCAFTAPTSGTSTAVESNSFGKLYLYGNCGYSGARAAPSIFTIYQGGFMAFGYYDPLVTNNLVFNISANPSLTGSTILIESGGNATLCNGSPGAVAWTGAIPSCAQYQCQTAGGLIFLGGSTGPNAFPGALPGIVTSPGWID